MIKLFSAISSSHSLFLCRHCSISPSSVSLFTLLYSRTFLYWLGCQKQEFFLLSGINISVFSGLSALNTCPSIRITLPSKLKPRNPYSKMRAFSSKKSTLYFFIISLQRTRIKEKFPPCHPDFCNIKALRFQTKELLNVLKYLVVLISYIAI